MHQTSCVDTAQQNGRVEHKHRHHLLNVARALRFQARLPKLFWGECVMAATHLINLTPTPVLHGKTPYELLYGVAPTYADVRVFGCLCYAANRPRAKDKFDYKSRRCIFVGYPFGKKGWRLFDLDTREFFVSRDVHFFESTFPYCDALSAADRQQWDAYLAQPSVWDDEVYAPPAENFVDEANRHGAPVVAPPSPAASPVGTPPSSPAHTPRAAGQSPPSVVRMGDILCDASPPHLRGSPLDVVPSATDNLGRGHRVKVPSVKVRSPYVTNTIILRNIDPTTSTAPPSSTGSSGKPFDIA